MGASWLGRLYGLNRGAQWIKQRRLTLRQLPGVVISFEAAPKAEE
jgi:hypothetical protein